MSRVFGPTDSRLGRRYELDTLFSWNAQLNLAEGRVDRVMADLSDHPAAREAVLDEVLALATRLHRERGAWIAAAQQSAVFEVFAYHGKRAFLDR